LESILEEKNDLSFILALFCEKSSRSPEKVTLAKVSSHKNSKNLDIIIFFKDLEKLKIYCQTRL